MANNRASRNGIVMEYVLPCLLWQNAYIEKLKMTRFIAPVLRLYELSFLVLYKVTACADQHFKGKYLGMTTTVSCKMSQSLCTRTLWCTIIMWLNLKRRGILVGKATYRNVCLPRGENSFLLERPFSKSQCLKKANQKSVKVTFLEKMAEKSTTIGSL